MSVPIGWYRQHPVIDRTRETPWLRVPVGIHGDDAGMMGCQQVLVVSWGSVAVKGSIIYNICKPVMLRDRLNIYHICLPVWSP